MITVPQTEDWIALKEVAIPVWNFEMMHTCSRDAAILAVIGEQDDDAKARINDCICSLESHVAMKLAGF